MSIEFLRCLPLFADLPEADLHALYQTAEVLTLSPGEWLMREGEMGEALYIVLEGNIEITKHSGEQDVALAVRGPGEVIGEMALLERAPRSASGRAISAPHSRLLKIDKEAFKQVLSANPSAALTLLHTFNLRLQSTEALLRQSEKMAALGTLAAGLAHELNNPAAAVKRSADHLRATLADWQRLTMEVEALAHEPHQREALNALRAEFPQRTSTPLSLDPFTHSERESDLQTWLEEIGVNEAWEVAPTLVSFGWEANGLQALGQTFSTHTLPVVVQWLAVSCSAYALLDELGAGAGRLSEIVGAIKAYTYLDQAPVQNVDIHAGLENTLVILRHKLRQGIILMRAFAPDVPRVEAYGSELNQVWTNLIDNAIDAMQGEGQLTLRTSLQANQVVVEIVDSGPGIPPEILPRIFEPFFTTKPPGAGTGLGLHIAHSIIARHHGQIRVTSEPGGTCFQVTLPIRLN
jgi:signal transduction histidine kinase